MTLYPRITGKGEILDGRERLRYSDCDGALQYPLPDRLRRLGFLYSHVPPHDSRRPRRGLSCAHRLALRGHNVTIFDANKKAGGLNEYGIAAYKTVENFAEKEIEWLLGIGGIVIEQDRVLGKDFSLDKILDEYDAVFLGVGLSGVNALNLNNENNTKIVDAVEFISGLRQTSNLESFPVGREVVVIVGGMTAVDAAVQSKLLGSEKVHSLRCCKILLR